MKQLRIVDNNRGWAYPFQIYEYTKDRKYTMYAYKKLNTKSQKYRNTKKENKELNKVKQMRRVDNKSWAFTLGKPHSSSNRWI